MDSIKVAKGVIYSAEYRHQSIPVPLYSRLFLPATFYPNVVKSVFNRDASDSTSSDMALINNTLFNVYLSHPDMISYTETQLADEEILWDNNELFADLPAKRVEQHVLLPDEPEPLPVRVMVSKPVFWEYKGDIYLQFLQNYVSGNWYKGGESTYSMVGAATFDMNYNNKQRVKWDNKLELKLGFQTSKSDSIHRYKTSEDLIRYTSKLGLQATKRWYYTVQFIAYTQFTRGYKANDIQTYSDFLSPFNANLSFGMDYSVEWLNKRLTGTFHLAPAAGNFRYVRLLPLSTRYGLKEGRHTMFDFGSQFTIDLNWAFNKLVRWQTRMYGYTTYRRVEFEWENTFSLQFNKFISAKLFLYPRFDDGAKRDGKHGYWQYKEFTSLGFSFGF